MNDMAARMGELSARFAARAVEERAELADAVAAGDREAVRQRAHKLAGVAAMFGHPAVGEAALALELAAERDERLEEPAATLDRLLAAI